MSNDDFFKKKIVKKNKLKSARVMRLELPYKKVDTKR
jgi:hypothetical protein